MQMTEQRAEPASTILVDIRDVSVSKELTREERISEFIRQIKDPYCFTVRASFAADGATLEDCIKGIIR